MALFSCIFSPIHFWILLFILVEVVWISFCQVTEPGANCFCQSEPCQDAVNIGDYRRSINFFPSPEDSLLCDRNINESLWYRFDAFTGGKMPESRISTLHCGTFLPIWMNDTHPTKKHPGPKSVKVCAPYWVAEVNYCDWTDTIEAQWCWDKNKKREYFVYQLKKPPFCSMAYCAGSGIACSTDCSWNGVTNNCTCPAYPPMTIPTLAEPRIVNGTKLVRNAYSPWNLFYPTRFVVDCVIGYTKQETDDGARFDLIFEVDGRFIARYTANSTDPVASLDEYFLIGYIGGKLTCRVSSYWDSSDAGSDYKFSDGRWFGLSPVNETGQVISNNLVVKEGQTVSFWMLPSFPITSRPCFDVPQFPCFYVTYSFSVHASDGVTKLSDCVLVFSQNFPRSAKKIEISPIPTIGGRQKPYIWQMGFNAYNDTIWNEIVEEPQRHLFTPIFKNYQPQPINIEIVDPDPQPLCKSTGDPHILAFPGPDGKQAYFHIYSVGDFYLVRLKSRNLEIQVRHAPCNPAAPVKVSCNCGIIAREGNTIFGINACDQPTPLLVNYRLDTVSPTGTIETKPTGWKMTLLSGIEIDVSTYLLGTFFLDIYVNGIGSELTLYDGLCSVQGLHDVECTTDCDQYRVAKENSFFSISATNLPKCGTPYLVPTCECYGKNIDRSVNVTCAQPSGDPMLHFDCTMVCMKRKRSTGSKRRYTSNMLDLDEMVYSPPSSFGTSTPAMNSNRNETAGGGRQAFIFHVDREGSLSEGGRSGGGGRESLAGAGLREITKTELLAVIPKITDEEAAKTCNETLKKSPVYDLCKDRVDSDIIIGNCVLDIKLLGSNSTAGTVSTQFSMECIRDIELSLEKPETKNVQALMLILVAVKELFCPSECVLPWGECVKGVCVCQPGKIGVACSLKENQAPDILRIIAERCDVRSRSCDTIYVQASDLAAPDSVFCKMSLETKIEGFPVDQYTNATISGGVAFCNLPLLPITIDGNKGSQSYYFVDISLSNNGVDYSQPEKWVVYDGRSAACSTKPTLSCRSIVD